MRKMTLPLLILALLLSSCDRITDRGKRYISAIAEELKEPVVTDKQIVELYPEMKNVEYKVQHMNGLQAEYLPAFNEYYFKYTGNQEKVLDFICGLEVNSYADIEPDSACTMIGANAVVDKKGLSDKTLKKLDFFFEYERLDDYQAYQTIKTPFEHTLIIDRKSDNIYHRIKEFKE